MPESPLTCAKCKQELFEQVAQSDPPQHCPHCDHQLRLALFPAWFRADQEKPRPTAAVVDDEASCFFHDKKQATTSCDACGRFICSLCDLELGGRHVCPRCLEAGSRKGNLMDLERQRTRYDQIAATLALFSLLFFFLAPMIAGIGLGLALWKWKAPPSRVANSRLIMGTAMVLLLLEFVGGIVLWYGAYKGF